jgi:predicted RNA-binding protein with RPS1 domain
MSKTIHFFGQSVFGQLISLICPTIITSATKQHKSDRYIKKFTTKDHLISMLFCCFAKCSSLREVCGAMLGLAGKTKHFKLDSLPYRSTLSDANKRRDVKVFSSIYHKLLRHYRYVISDSRFKQVLGKQVEVLDSTVISLFQEIMKCVGRKPKSGKRKGGVKMHTTMNVDEMVPKMIWLTSASRHDHYALGRLKKDPNTIYVFDKGYNDYIAFAEFCQTGTGFVTRIKDNAVYEVSESLAIADHIHSGVLEDTIITLTVKNNKEVSSLKLRKVRYYDRELKREFEFLTNLMEIRADMIAALYKIRWQIETLFKQFKQNFPLKYFLGDNENAIKIQIYCALIVNLLMRVVQKRLKRRWAFSNLVSFCKIHLFNYLNLMSFLENPEKDWLKVEKQNPQLTLF